MKLRDLLDYNWQPFLTWCSQLLPWVIGIFVVVNLAIIVLNIWTIRRIRRKGPRE